MDGNSFDADSPSVLIADIYPVNITDKMMMCLIFLISFVSLFPTKTLSHTHMHAVEQS